ncbi:MAG: SPASM domain-containing protein, partial [Desulfovibrio sp.]|jgi:radical SAM protein with 4Fe4S-binding SPASM domain|nr:SPASM domain-containing protein [Desulfovibrio sp.]
MRQNSSFEKLVENIKAAYRIRGNGKLPYIHISTTTTYESDDAIKKFKDKFISYCDRLTVGKTMLEHIEINDTKLTESQKRQLSELKLKQAAIKDRYKICPEVWGKISIDWDGKITACCADYNREMVIGDIWDNSLYDIYHNEIIENYRKMLRERMFEKIPLCKRCFDLMGIQGENRIVARLSD